MDTVTLTDYEFKNAWNAKCDLYFLISRMEDVLAPSVIKDLRKVYREIESAVKRPMAVRDEEHDLQRKHYEEVQFANQLTSIWSNYDVKNMSDYHPFYDARILKYEGKEYDISWNKTAQTWLGLWKVADCAIVDSGDTHHIFIEDFSLSKDGSTITLCTGS